jgi:hypothetical protein
MLSFKEFLVQQEQMEEAYGFGKLEKSKRPEPSNGAKLYVGAKRKIRNRQPAPGEHAAGYKTLKKVGRGINAVAKSAWRNKDNRKGMIKGMASDATRSTRNKVDRWAYGDPKVNAAKFTGKVSFQTAKPKRRETKAARKDRIEGAGKKAVAASNAKHLTNPDTKPSPKVMAHTKERRINQAHNQQKHGKPTYSTGYAVDKTQKAPNPGKTAWKAAKAGAKLRRSDKQPNAKNVSSKKVHTSKSSGKPVGGKNADTG